VTFESLRVTGFSKRAATIFPPEDEIDNQARVLHPSLVLVRRRTIPHLRVARFSSVEIRISPTSRTPRVRNLCLDIVKARGGERDAFRLQSSEALPFSPQRVAFVSKPSTQVSAIPSSPAPPFRVAHHLLKSSAESLLNVTVVTIRDT
jgi:hypothetical protein